MLKELYDYAISHELYSKPGFKYKKIKAFISIGKDGKFVAIDPGGQKEYFCPDNATNGNFSNIIAEKAEIVFGMYLDETKSENGEKPSEKKKKTREDKITFYKTAFSLGKMAEPLFGIIEGFMDNETEFQKAKECFYAQKYKDTDIISFKVDGEVLVEKISYHDWWQEYLKNLWDKGKAVKQSRCFVTGQLCNPEATVKKISGLQSVGGHTSGDSLICFDKAAFKSYGFNKAANAAISSEAAAAVNAALERLIKKSYRLANAKFVHWYKEPLKNEIDPIDLFMGEDEEESDEEGFDEAEQKEEELTADKQAQQLLSSMEKGETPKSPNNRYYTMLLSGNGGRIMIRDYMEGSYEDVYNSFWAWYSDLSLVRCGKPGKLPHLKLFTIYTRLLTKRKHSERKIGERIDKELSGLSREILRTILINAPLPDAMADRALAYIRSDIINLDDERTKNICLDATACRILKAWLLRKNRNKDIKEEFQLKAELNSDYEGKAYHLGRLMAVYAKLQEEALGNVGAGVIQRYYTSASVTPALVLGKLSTLSQYHLSKLKSKPAQIHYNKMLQEISNKIECPLPSTLTLTEQSEFALGYYHQMAELYKPSKNEAEESEEN